ncbi:MAG: hypothetical protein NT147_05715 [Candidatus Aminicenantes bacterium]|nr:hypothetical protein [Candidatus Aminicenantes bacterium]
MERVGHEIGDLADQVLAGCKFADLVETAGGEVLAFDPAALDRQDLSLVREILEDLGQTDRVLAGESDGRGLLEEGTEGFRAALAQRIFRSSTDWETFIFL